MKKELISEKELVKIATAARTDHAQGKTKKFKSLATLVKLIKAERKHP